MLILLQYLRPLLWMISKWIRSQWGKPFVVAEEGGCQYLVNHICGHQQTPRKARIPIKSHFDEYEAVWIEYSCYFKVNYTYHSLLFLKEVSLIPS